MSKTEDQKYTIVFTVIVVLVVLIIGILISDGGSSGGDGKTTCRNCGRDKPLSIMGYCSTCQKGFNEWQQKEYEKNHYVPKY